MSRQKTLAKQVDLNGVGVHSGLPVHVCLKPAPQGTGIIFVRTDVKDQPNVIPALWSYVVDTRLCTLLANSAGVKVGTIEHLMAALRGADVSNVIIEIDGPEVPIMDGSSAAFIEAIDSVGVVEQEAPVYAIKVLEPIEVRDGDKYVRLMPSDQETYSGTIIYENQVIGHQSYEMTFVNGNFRHELADSRTFGLFEEVDALRSMGLAKGGSLENAIVVTKDSVMNPEGLRHEDEFIRHKLLDAVGDLYLAGAPVIAAYEGVRLSHGMNNALLRTLFARPQSWVRVEMGTSVVREAVLAA